ncbi:signal recognition particle, SRP9/SRP14 subunit [Lentithecium fluviatile CBS 122367]|uniref:Signal recognition particle subunit SRP14 n=1 Tax=Lentithecium fluviatile CBS 122367 TaxID=1168545 RepID=A0A6G1JBV9_9PLEO|nr:signal recognition particle, SRP9/SRP14 subunit [Lentithecium fluviatile CBS 122367]
MAGDHLSNDEFFAQLANLFEHNRKKGHSSVYLVQKRLSFDSSAAPPTPTKVADDPLWDTHPENPLPILIRASNNKSDKRPGTDREDIVKIKLSTVVQPDDLDAFYLRYAEACRAGMSGLKKRDKKKGKKDKKKKKKGVGEIKG